MRRNAAQTDICEQHVKLLTIAVQRISGHAESQGSNELPQTRIVQRQMLAPLLTNRTGLALVRFRIEQLENQPHRHIL